MTIITIVVILLVVIGVAVIYVMNTCNIDDNNPSEDSEDSKEKVSAPPVQCPHAGCYVKVPAKDLEYHKSTCPKRLVRCQFCKKNWPQESLEAHTKSCSARPPDMG